MTKTATRSSSIVRAECRIDLGALRHNIHTLSARLTGGAKLWAVVKANAYGHDVLPVAEAAIAAGVKRLCVATLSEGWHLRQQGLRVPILVMGPLDRASLKRALDLDLSVTVLSLPMLESLQALAAERVDARPARVHLKIDTGMGRWGVPLASASGALAQIVALDGVELEGVMTHFATADDPDQSFLHGQIAAFEPLVAEARTLAPSVVAHAANSAALLSEPRSHFDAVRCGLALYGLSPAQGDPAADDLRPVLSLRSHVADIRMREPGESVGYSRTFVATQSERVALVPVGYADGIRRSLSNTGEALVGGKRRSYVGNVSMDHISLLVDDQVQPGDSVVLLGSQGAERITAEQHAAHVGTINYEITCGIAGEPRLRRIHTTEG